MRAEIVETLVGPFHKREDVGFAVRLMPENVSEGTLLEHITHHFIHCSCDNLDNRYQHATYTHLVDRTEIDLYQHGERLRCAEVHFSTKPVGRQTLAASLSRVIERASRTETGHRVLSVEELEHVILDAIESPYKLALRD